MTGALTDGIRELIAQADECKRSGKKGDLFNAGRLQGLCEALHILQTYFVGERSVEALLGFDIDERYLCAPPQKETDPFAVENKILDS